MMPAAWRVLRASGNVRDLRTGAIAPATAHLYAAPGRLACGAAMAYMDTMPARYGTDGAMVDRACAGCADSIGQVQ
jgi:hypothetical protein